MSQFEKVFGALASGGEESRETYLARLQLLGLSYDDAYMVEQCIQRSIGRAYAAIGKGLDDLPARVQADALPPMLDMFATHAQGLQTYIIEVTFGLRTPTSGCDCEACAQVKALREELAASSEAGDSAEREQGQ